MDEIGQATGPKLERIQKQYLFLDRYDIHTMTDLTSVIGSLQEKDAQAVSEKRKVYREKQRFLPLFEIAKQMEMLENAHAAYTNGDSFFEKEEKQWQAYGKKLEEAGYGYEEIKALQEHFRQRIAEVIQKDAALKRELACGNSIFHENMPQDSEITPAEKEEKNRNNDRTQPIR